MPRPCTICTHPERAAIDRAIIAGESMPALAARYSTESRKLNRMAVQRHKDEHLPAALVNAAANAESAAADDLLAEVRKLQSTTQSILDQALGAADLRTALAAVREARGNTELLAKLLGELHDAATVNVIISPQWVQLRAAIVTTLAPYPEARQAVASALLAIEGDNAGA